MSRCNHCGKLFRGSNSEASLQEHIANIHLADLLTDKNCDKLFANGAAFLPDSQQLSDALTSSLFSRSSLGNSSGNSLDYHLNYVESLDLKNSIKIY